MTETWGRAAPNLAGDWGTLMMFMEQCPSTIQIYIVDDALSTVYIMDRFASNGLMQLLKDKGLTQQDLANMAGVSLNTAQRWVHGRQLPTFAPWEFFALAKKLGISPIKLSQVMREAYERGQAKTADEPSSPGTKKAPPAGNAS